MSELAIKGGSKVREKPFPGWPIWDESDCEVLVEVCRSGQWWCVGGTKVKEFEESFAAYCGCKVGVCVPNGTIALIVAMKALGIGYTDEVIVTPYTFVASASSILQCNAIPVFVDIDPDTYNIDPSKIEAAITENTKAIMAVHIAGLPCDMDSILQIARKHNLKVVEDCAQAHGAEWNGRRVGSFGDAAAFSFQASKNLTSGEGGIVVTTDEEVGERAWSIHNVGRVKDGAWYHHPVMGSNYRMTEFQAAILLNQMRKLDVETARRNENALYLTERLSQIDDIKPLKRDERVTRHAYHLYIFRYQGEGTTGVSRSKFIEALNAEGIPCGAGYLPLYRTGMFDIDPDSCPVGCPLYGKRVVYRELYLENCERACDHEAVWLGQNMLLGERSDMDDIANAVEKIMSNISELRE
ncbi:MAG: DegT/DnrJ/EryC1/StrS family aminotransferase [Armatimonadota bacterium]